MMAEDGIVGDIITDNGVNEAESPIQQLNNEIILLGPL